MRKLLFLVSLCFYSLNSYGIQNNLKSSEAQSSNANQSSLTLEKIIVTAPKTSLTSDDFSTAQEKINQISGSTALINGKDLQNKFSYNVKDMFDYVAGIVAQSKAGQESRLSIRGSGLSRNYHLRGINLYQDGIPINLADGSADFQDIDSNAFDHIEIFKGANGLHLGSATLGGAINYISPTGYNSSILKSSIETGSFGTLRANLSSGKILGKFDYFTSLSNYHSDGYRNQNSQSEIKSFSNFGYKINKNLENRTYLTLVNSNLELPGGITRGQLNSTPKKANDFNISNQQERNFNLFRLANKTSFRSENISGNAGFFTNIKDLDHPIFLSFQQKTKHFGGFIDGVLKNNLANLNNEILFGLNLSTANTNAKRFLNLNGSSGKLVLNGDEKSTNAIFFAQDNLSINKKLTLNLGSQFIFSKRDYRDFFLSDGNQSGKRFYHGFSPKFGGIYQQNKNLQFFSNLSSAYEPPTFSELSAGSLQGLNNISAQKSYTLEIGTRKINGIFNWDFTLYRSHLRDELILFAIPSANSEAINAKKTIHQGLELAFDSSYFSKILSQNSQNSGDKIKIKTAYSFNDFRFVDDLNYRNNQIPGAPIHYLRSEIKYENSLGFFIAPNLEISPRGFFIDSANTMRSQSYWLLGLNLGHNINKNFMIYLDARNILNQKHSPTTDVLAKAESNNQNVYFPGNARSLFAGLKFKW